MNLHEFQAKAILSQFHIPVPRGKIAQSPEEAERIVSSLGGEKFVVKAQIHAGGRGKAGGVVLVDRKEKVRPAAERLLGQSLKTPQTGPAGQPVDQVLIQVQTEIAKEFYAAVTLDRSAERPCLLFSGAGGMEIEEVARTIPKAIHKRTFSAASAISLEVARSILEEQTTERCLSHASLSFQEKERLAEILVSLTKVFLEKDASLVEINPLAQTPSGDFLAVDAKIRLDDNGLERHPDLAKLHDPRQEDPRETEAKKFGLSYVGLEGNIGCMVNGAGLAMATMDLIKHAGGEPANFLDVGGGASAEKVTAAFKIILQDPKVKAILVNIFGGIMRCDVIAEGILAAVKELGSSVGAAASPLYLVVRLEGTNVKKGKEILGRLERTRHASPLQLISAENFERAAKKAVECAAAAHR